MGKIPPIVTVVIGVILVLGLSAACFFMLIKPRSEALAEARSAYEAADQKAKTLDKVKADNVQAVQDWLKAQADVEKLMATRSTPVSFYEPIAAWIALWQEYRVTLPRAVERFIQSFGVRIVSGASVPAPPGAPPPPPGNGYMHVPESSVQVVVQGTLAQIERLYRAVGTFQRIMTVSGLNLAGSDDLITATIPMDFYLLVEVPPGAAPAAAAAPTGPPAPGPVRGPTRKAEPEEDGDEDTGSKIGNKGGDGLE